MNDLSTNSPRLEGIKTYCLADCSSLFFSMYLFFENNFTDSVVKPFAGLSGLVVTRAFTTQLFSISAASFTKEKYQTCYSYHTLRGNIEALEIERESYMGGQTDVVQSKLLIGISLDINSSYPAAMSNPMPVHHVGSEGEQLSPNKFGYMSRQQQAFYAQHKTIRTVKQEVSGK